MRQAIVALLAAWLLALAAPAALDAQATPPFDATVTARSNIRSGPGTTYRIVDVATPGAVVQVVGCNEDCSWYELADGTWIYARLVNPIAETAGAEASATRPYTMPDASTLTAAAVVRIVDGDTIRVRIGGVEYPVRYIGVNTPEVGQPYADAATALNRSLVSGQTVYLEKDVSETDRYNRLLRYVWLADGTLVNYELVRQGYAQVATYPPDVKYEALYREAQRQAMAEGVGLWADAAEGTATATPVPVAAVGATANRNANLRGGPGTHYPIVGSVTAGQTLQITGRNQAGDWYQLASGEWIAAFLVNDAPGGLPVVTALAVPAEPAPAPVDTTVVPERPTATPVPIGSAKVVIQSINYDGVVPRVESDEYVVITNTGTAPQNLTGWRLNADDPGQDFHFPNYTLAPGESCRVYTNEFHPETCGFSFGSSKALWANDGECGHLYDANGVEVSTWCY